MPSFKDSQESQKQNLLRSFVKKSELSRAQKDVTVYILNYWFKYKAKNGVASPGQSLLAKRAKCSVRTVASTMKMLRECGALIPVEYDKGGKYNTRYKIDETAIMVMCGAKIPETIVGTLTSFKAADSVQNSAQKCTQKTPENVVNFSDYCML